MKKFVCLAACIAFVLSLSVPAFAVTSTRERGMPYQGTDHPKVNPESIKQKTSDTLGKTEGKKLERTPGGAKDFGAEMRAEDESTARASGRQHVETWKTKICNKIERKE
ncbi:MAG: hypothetical protein JW728_07320 [Candidatus Aureabacteria bacterium]|nr:hypothetical protein [Candidatus Auribacterota bacterium]